MTVFLHRSSLFAIAVALGSATGAVATPAWAETLQLGHHHAVGGTVDMAANRLAELVAEKSGGDLTIDVFPAAQLGQELEAFQLLDQGAIDMTITSLGLMDQYYPPMAVTSLPFFFTSWEQAEELYGGEFGEELAAGLAEETDVRLLDYLYLGFRDMLFREDAVVDAAEMEGLRMRSPESFVWIRMFELLGARPTPVTWGEVYTAMQTGVAAGLESPAMAALDMRFNEVTSALVKTHHMFGSMAFAINEDTWSGLSAEHQAILQEAADEAADYANFEVSKPGEDAAYDRLAEAGVEILEPENPDVWQEAVRPLWQEVAEERPGSQAFIDMVYGAQ